MTDTTQPGDVGRPEPPHVIALDVDGVILNLDRTARQILQKIERNPPDITTRSFGEAWGLRPTWFDTHKFWPQIWASTLSAYPDVDALAALTDWADLHLVTHRPKGAPANALKRNLHALHLSHLFTAVHTVEQKHDKQAVLNEIRADIYVDDHLPTLLDLEGPQLLLRSHPWNQSQDIGKHYHRINSLYTLITYMNP